MHIDGKVRIARVNGTGQTEVEIMSTTDHNDVVAVVEPAAEKDVAAAVSGNKTCRFELDTSRRRVVKVVPL